MMADLSRRAVSPSAAPVSDLSGSIALPSLDGQTGPIPSALPTTMGDEAEDPSAEVARAHRAVSEDTEGHNCIICLQTIVDRTVIVRPRMRLRVCPCCRSLTWPRGLLSSFLALFRRR